MKDFNGTDEARGLGPAFVWNIKSQSGPLWAQWRVLQAVGWGPLLGANLHVYFPRTRLEKMNGQTCP